ncbi:MAG: hypothetical protein ABIO24_11750 [Saprospiraceae bacterium]
MNRTIGIILIVLGVIFAGLALTQHEDDKTLLDLGKIEIKKQDQSPSSNTTMYYVLAAICVIGGGAMVAGKKS